MKIAVSAESTVDLPVELLSKYDISTVPFSILLGDKVGADGEIKTDEIIEYVNATGKLPKTGAVNRAAYEEHFTNLLKNYDAIVHFTLSSELSSAFDNATATASEMKNVFVIDSRSLSTGIALLCIYARSLAEKGLSAKEVNDKCLERVPFVQASFALKRLDYLYKGGRCSSLMYFGANLLKIRPQIIVKNGKMISGKKYRGNFSAVVHTYVKDTLDAFNNPDLSNVFITYTTAEQETLDAVKETLAEAGFKNIMLTRAGGTITSHCGENCLGILYINDGCKD